MSSPASARDRAEIRKKNFATLVSENDTYPLATITYHGPDPDQATKIVVAVLPGESQEPIIREWTGKDIAEDVEAAREIAAFIKEQQVARVITSEWVLSCPHEEGKDFPPGEDCPHCSAWKTS